MWTKFQGKSSSAERNSWWRRLLHSPFSFKIIIRIKVSPINLHIKWIEFHHPNVGMGKEAKHGTDKMRKRSKERMKIKLMGSVSTSFLQSLFHSSLPIHSFLKIPAVFELLSLTYLLSSFNLKISKTCQVFQSMPQTIFNECSNYFSYTTAYMLHAHILYFTLSTCWRNSIWNILIKSNDSSSCYVWRKRKETRKQNWNVRHDQQGKLKHRRDGATCVGKKFFLLFWFLLGSRFNFLPLTSFLLSHTTCDHFPLFYFKQSMGSF